MQPAVLSLTENSAFTENRYFLLGTEVESVIPGEHTEGFLSRPSLRQSQRGGSHEQCCCNLEASVFRPQHLLLLINSTTLNYSAANIYKNEANYESGETREIILRGQLTFLP